jgi:hypothetical protein
VAKRPKFSRWRRLPTVYRSGEHRLLDPNQEPQRLTLYVPAEALDRAEAQAARLGFADAQEYCTEVVLKAIEEERVREQMAEVEARRGPLDGFRAIEEDPEYLADLRTAQKPRERPEVEPIHYIGDDQEALPAPTDGDGGSAGDSSPLPVRVTIEASSLEPEGLSPSAWVVLRHAAQAQDDPSAFLPSLRRGVPVPPEAIAELAQALQQLENEYRGTRSIDRRLTFALHRLAFESQILHTDAWPGAFDSWTVDMLRSVQEAVERILSGQDIRYYPHEETPEGRHAGSPSTSPESHR